MKKIIAIIGLVGLMGTGSAFARNLDLSGSISLRDGGQVVRINIGKEERQDNRSMSRRINRLERAVRALQNRVYDLEDDVGPVQTEVTIYTCTLPTSFDGTFIGKGKTEAEARANAVNACEAGGGFPCRDRRVKTCETNLEFLSH